MVSKLESTRTSRRRSSSDARYRKTSTSKSRRKAVATSRQRSPRTRRRSPSPTRRNAASPRRKADPKRRGSSDIVRQTTRTVKTKRGNDDDRKERRRSSSQPPGGKEKTTARQRPSSKPREEFRHDDCDYREEFRHDDCDYRSDTDSSSEDYRRRCSEDVSTSPLEGIRVNRKKKEATIVIQCPKTSKKKDGGYNKRNNKTSRKPSHPTSRGRSRSPPRRNQRRNLSRSQSLAKLLEASMDDTYSEGCADGDENMKAVATSPPAMRNQSSGFSEKEEVHTSESSPSEPSSRPRSLDPPKAKGPIVSATSALSSVAAPSRDNIPNLLAATSGTNRVPSPISGIRCTAESSPSTQRHPSRSLSPDTKPPVPNKVVELQQENKMKKARRGGTLRRWFSSSAIKTTKNPSSANTNGGVPAAALQEEVKAFMESNGLHNGKHGKKKRRQGLSKKWGFLSRSKKKEVHIDTIPQAPPSSDENVIKRTRDYNSDEYIKTVIDGAPLSTLGGKVKAWDGISPAAAEDSKNEDSGSRSSETDTSTIRKLKDIERLISGPTEDQSEDHHEEMTIPVEAIIEETKAIIHETKSDSASEISVESKVSISPCDVVRETSKLNVEVINIDLCKRRRKPAESPTLEENSIVADDSIDENEKSSTTRCMADNLTTIQADVPSMNGDRETNLPSNGREVTTNSRLSSNGSFDETSSWGCHRSSTSNSLTESSSWQCGHHSSHPLTTAITNGGSKIVDSFVDCLLFAGDEEHQVPKFKTARRARRIPT